MNDDIQKILIGWLDIRLLLNEKVILKENISIWKFKLFYREFSNSLLLLK